MKRFLRLATVAFGGTALVLSALAPCVCAAMAVPTNDHGCCEEPGLRAHDGGCCPDGGRIEKPAVAAAHAPAVAGLLVEAPRPAAVTAAHCQWPSSPYVPFHPSPVLRI